ncbi:MAG: hypothetical protein Q8N83_00280 [Ignavibacteria bacterium]|nr:hypothetical protein [Ignavibacteria bacterium]
MRSNNLYDRNKCQLCQNGKPLNIGDDEDWVSIKSDKTEFYVFLDQVQKGYWMCFEEYNSEHIYICPNHNSFKPICKLKKVE